MISEKFTNKLYRSKRDEDGRETFQKHSQKILRHLLKIIVRYLCNADPTHSDN